MKYAPLRSRRFSQVAQRWVFSILITIRDGLYAGPPKCGEHIECCRVLSVLTPFILAYYTNVIIGHHSGATAIWQGATLEFVIVARMRFFVVARDFQWGNTVVILLSGMVIEAWLLVSRQTYDVLSTIMALLSLFLDVRLTLLPPSWCINP